MLEDRILFIDGEAIVIDKPAGLPVDTPKRGGPSIESRLDELRCGFKRKPVIMHRLDQDTSGCLLLARNPSARAALQQAFEARAVEKYYLALTGRTHQIRVHAREAFGSGIVGDRVYGIPGGPMLLHASRLVVPRDTKPA